MSYTDVMKKLRRKDLRFPLGKIDTPDSYRLKGENAMHVLVKDEKSGEWRLKCAPTKIADYNYTGFLSSVTCTKCPRGVGNGDSN